MNQFPGTNYQDLNLDWLLDQMKTCLAEWASTKSDWESLAADNATFKATIESEWDEVQAYINNYFTNLDVSAEISAKINAMAADGSLLALISSTVQTSATSAATTWISENIHDAQYPLDDSLSTTGAAADAKVVGDKFSAIAATEAEIIDPNYNRFFITDDTEKAFTNNPNIEISFNSKSSFNLSGETTTSEGIKLPCMGNASYNTGTFRKNIDAGTYYIYIDRGGLAASRLYVQYRYSGQSAISVSNDSVITLTEDAEFMVTFSTGNPGYTYDNTVRIMVCKTKQDYIDYGNLSANDKYARASISGINAEIEELSERNQMASWNDFNAFLLKKTQIIPSYYFSEYGSEFNKREYMENKIASIPNGKHFIFYSDVHWKTNRKNSTSLIEYVRSRMQIDNVFMGGDILNREETKYLASQQMALYMDEMYSAVGRYFYSAMGDHDNNTANYDGNDLSAVMLPYSIIKNQLVDPIENKIHQESDDEINARLDLITDLSEGNRSEIFAFMKLHYYIDDEEQKIRYIVLASGATNNGVLYDVFGLNGTDVLSMQIPWYYSALASTPANYDIVVVMHNTVSIKNGAAAFVSTSTGRIQRMASARSNNDSVTLSITNENTAYNEAFSDVVGDVVCDFSDDSTVANVIVLGGDNHINMDCIATKAIAPTPYQDRVIASGDVLSTTIQTDNSHQHNNSVSSDYQGEDSRMTDGTVTEQAFDVVTISGKIITMTRFGAGVDRVFDMTILDNT